MRLALAAALLVALLRLGSLPSGAAEAPAGEVASFVGERLRWEVRYAGIAVGAAWAEARPEGGAVILEAGARNAAWYESIYVVDDLVRSTWRPGEGSLRYQTWFREGSFHQDQDMRLEARGIEVWRRQLRDGAWQESTDRYAAAPGAEDPMSALYALRLAEGEGPWRYVVWNGKKALTVVATAGPEETMETALGELRARRVSLGVPHDGEVKQKGAFVVWLSADARRLPVRAELDANVGAFRADLIGVRSPDGSVWGAPETEQP